MTIKIKREAMVSVVGALLSPLSSNYPVSLPLSSNIATGESAKAPPVSWLNWDQSAVEVIGKPTTEMYGSSHNHLPELEDTDDEESTIASSVDSFSTSDPPRSVTFCEPLVTEVRTRPRTDPEDIRTLFYSYEETQRFRQDYREEKRLQSLEDASSKSSGETTTSSSTSPPSSADNTHRISRVVVTHENSRETFFDKEHLPATKFLTNPNCQAASDDFFDNNSFWSGQITWY